MPFYIWFFGLNPFGSFRYFGELFMGFQTMFQADRRITDGRVQNPLFFQGARAKVISP
jgi:hypothetical protein